MQSFAKIITPLAIAAIMLPWLTSTSNSINSVLPTLQDTCPINRGFCPLKPHLSGTNWCVVDPASNLYLGGILSGCYHGQGRMNSTCGDFFEGSYEYGHLHGRGRYYLRNGEFYEGNFVHGKKHGEGTLRCSDGSHYTGSFAFNQPDGKGTLRFTDGTIYDGEFVNGLRDGNGIQTHSDGFKYIGSFEKGKRHGKGSLLRESGIGCKDYVWYKGELGLWNTLKCPLSLVAQYFGLVNIPQID